MFLRKHVFVVTGNGKQNVHGHASSTGVWAESTEPKAVIIVSIDEAL
jgi:hypothetical protein